MLQCLVLVLCSIFAWNDDWLVSLLTAIMGCFSCQVDWYTSKYTSLSYSYVRSALHAIVFVACVVIGSMQIISSIALIWSGTIVILSLVSLILVMCKSESTDSDHNDDLLV